MSRIYKNIIIGATPEGLALAAELAGETNDTLLVSSHFMYGEKPIPGVEFFTAEAVYLQYSHGLFVLSVVQETTKGMLCGLSVIFATGTRPIKTTLKNSNIHYKALDLPGRHKSEPVVIYGNNDDSANYALELSKRYRYVYLCTKEFNLACKPRLVKKINNTANIVHLPSCNIMSCKNDKSGKLAEVTLDTYASIKSSGLIFALGRIPDIPAFSKHYIAEGPSGTLQTKAFNESTLVPGVYAIGALCEKFSKKDLIKLAEHLKSKGD